MATEKTNDELINSFENAEDMTDAELQKVAEIEPKYASMIETLKEEDLVISDETKSNTSIK